MCLTLFQVLGVTEIKKTDIPCPDGNYTKVEGNRKMYNFQIVTNATEKINKGRRMESPWRVV